MNRHINHLSQVLGEMRDRYGSEDPLVLQLKATLDHLKATKPLCLGTDMPFGERRSPRIKPSYWNVTLRHTHQHPTRRDILEQCHRVELRTHNC